MRREARLHLISVGGDMWHRDLIQTVHNAESGSESHIYCVSSFDGISRNKGEELGRTFEYKIIWRSITGSTTERYQIDPAQGFLRQGRTHIAYDDSIVAQLKWVLRMNYTNINSSKDSSLESKDSFEEHVESRVHNWFVVDERDAREFLRACDENDYAKLCLNTFFKFFTAKIEGEEPHQQERRKERAAIRAQIERFKPSIQPALQLTEALFEFSQFLSVVQGGHIDAAQVLVFFRDCETKNYKNLARLHAPPL
jgi:hypothetical protein